MVNGKRKNLVFAKWTSEEIVGTVISAGIEFYSIDVGDGIKFQESIKVLEVFLSPICCCAV